MNPSSADDRLGYESLGADIGRLVEGKQAAYGDSFGRSGAVMRLLYPEGIPPEKMDDALAVVRVLDKLFRIATDRDALGESPWRDVAGYALLGTARVERAVESDLERAERLLDLANAERAELRARVAVLEEDRAAAEVAAFFAERDGSAHTQGGRS